LKERLKNTFWFCLNKPKWNILNSEILFELAEVYRLKKERIDRGIYDIN